MDRLLRRGSVQARTTFAAVAVVGAALILGALALVASLHAALLREKRAAATLRATEAVRMLESGRDPAAAAAGDDDVVLQVISPSGEMLAATPNAAGLPALVPGGEVDVSFDDDPFLVVSALANDGRVVMVGHTLDSVSASTRTLAGLLGLAVPILLLVVGATTWRAVGQALTPVDAIRAEVDAISATQLHRRVPQPATQDEIERLAVTMNRMLDRLEQAHMRERRFVADASHELRSPIAAIRQHAEIVIAHPSRFPADELARAVHAESLRMQALVDDLLLLAQADAHTLSPRRQPVDLDDLVLAEARRIRNAAQTAVDTKGISAARVDADPTALRRAFRNLSDNACRHSRHNVAFSLSERDGWAVLHVDDDGPGVPAADRFRIFERFVRLDHARSHTAGSGLGLAIVAEIIAAHGGTVVITDSPLGGARVTVQLPDSA